MTDQETGTSGGSEAPGVRVIVTTSTLPFRDGDGVPRFVLDLAQALAGVDAVDVYILAPDCPDAPRQHLVGPGMIRRFRYFWPRSAQRLTAGGVMAVNLRGWNWALVPFLLVAQIVATYRLVRAVGANVINAHWLVPQGLTAAVVSRTRGIPLVLHVHAGDVYRLRRVPGAKWIARFVLDSCSKVFVDGSHVLRALDLLVGESTGATIRPMGVWTEQFAPDGGTREPRRVVFVGRLVEKKGVYHLIDAMVPIKDRYPDVKLLVIGDGPLGAELRAHSRSCGLGETVEFLGPLAHSEIAAEFRRATVACVPSVVDSRGEADGMPTVVLEAMAAGLRVVGTDVGGIPDVVRDRENGWLARAGDTDDLTRQLMAALEAPPSRELERSILATATRHDWSVVAQEYAESLRRVVNG